jgi:hypothetical protein
VIVQGDLLGGTDQSNSPKSAAEYATIHGQPVQDKTNQLTTITLHNPLANQYSRSSTVVFANLASITQGQTVRDEVLGSGAAVPFQSFALKKKPLTYLPSTDAEGLSAVSSTLLVNVNGVLWNEEPTLLESSADAQAYTTTLDSTGQTTIVFGDGFNGALPPTVVENIHARYRT